MTSNALADRDTVLGALDAIDAALDVLGSASLDGFSSAELLELLARREVIARRGPTVDHRLLQVLQSQARPGELGASTWSRVLAGRLHISSGEACRRIADADVLGPRRTLEGEPLAPAWPQIAAAHTAGQLGAEHLRIIRDFFKNLPAQVDTATREAAEKDLARLAGEFGPAEFRRATNLLLALLHPDGDFDDADRQRRRGLRIGPQGADGLSTITGTLTPHCRAVFEAILAKLAAPGMCNPDDPTPCVTGRPSAEQIAADQRSPAQRCHDGLLAAGRIVLSTKKLGELNGLPVTVIVTTTLAELEAGAGIAITGGGSRMSMPELIRTAAEAYHYLVIFDGEGKTLHLGRSQRTANLAQRIALFGRDHGCTRPGCTASGYQCQAHHLETDWIDGGLTNIDTLALACGSDNRMCTEFGWDTHLNTDGRVEWIPPPHLDHGQPRINPLHHPRDLLATLTDDPSPPTVPDPPLIEKHRPPEEPDRHDNATVAYLLAHAPDVDENGAWLTHHPDDDWPPTLSPYYHDILGHNDDPAADAYDDWYHNLDPDLIAALDPDHDHLEETLWAPRLPATWN